jgi:redox-sensitive bicupin YhaK (pirin superfamily)
MSTNAVNPVSAEHTETSPCDGIAMVIEPAVRPIDSFTVRRYLPHINCRKVGPFVFFDHMGPADFAPGTGMDVRPHPHIGLSTLTYLFKGEILHRDSLGFVQAITPGAVNWMTAGRGIVHSERTGAAARGSGQSLQGLQVWVALPEEHEETTPGFFHYAANELPEWRQDGITLRLVAGAVGSRRSPVKTYSPLFYLDLNMPASATIRLPEEYVERAFHVIEGEVRVKQRLFGAFSMALCRQSVAVEVTAVRASRLITFGGAPITDRYVWWNFVSSSRERIEQAKLDWQNDKFGRVPGETEFIPLPEKR